MIAVVAASNAERPKINPAAHMEGEGRSAISREPLLSLRPLNRQMAHRLFFGRVRPIATAVRTTSFLILPTGAASGRAGERVHTAGGTP